MLCVFFLSLFPHPVKKKQSDAFVENDLCIVVACELLSTGKINSFRVKGSPTLADTDKVKTPTLGQNVDTWKSQLESESNK